MAFAESYKQQHLDLSGAWRGNRCFEEIRRPIIGHGSGLTRGVRIYFPEAELRSFDDNEGVKTCKSVYDIPASQSGQVTAVDLVFTETYSRFSEFDPPLTASIGAKQIANWTLPNGQAIWLMHFTWSAASESLDPACRWHRQNLSKALKLDTRDPLDLDAEESRIMIVGVNEQTWFSVIDAAAN